MRKIHGFRLKHRVTTLFGSFLHKNRPSHGYSRVDPPSCRAARPILRFLHCLKKKAVSLCAAKPGVGWRISGRGYVPLTDDRFPPAVAAVPKGHMAVYVGQKDGEFHRFLVPVIYFNHPLFGNLLREAEEEFGFNHSGGITIPCRVSEFESVQTQIAAGRGGRKLLSWGRA